MNSVLASSIAQILALDGDQRRRKRIDRTAQQPAAVRAALLIPDDPTDPTNATRNAELLRLSKGFPDTLTSFQIDPAWLKGENDLEIMLQRALDGRTWVLAEGMSDANLAEGEDQSLIPKGAIIVTTNFDTPYADNVVNFKPFKWPAITAAKNDLNPSGDPHGIGCAYWPLNDTEPELRVSLPIDGLGEKYQKLSVQYGNSGGFALLWVRLK